MFKQRTPFSLLLGLVLLLSGVLSSAAESAANHESHSAAAILSERNQRVVDGYLLAALQPIVQGQQISFVPEWKKNARHLGQAVRFGLTPEAFADAKRRYLHQGYRLSWSQDYELNSVIKVAAIWTEDVSAKVQFRSKLGFEQAIANYRRSNSGGLVVVAGHRGSTVFSRGFGRYSGRAVYADTVFPALAASQAIAGVLAARLEQQQHTAAGVPINLSLDWAVADLLPMMPSQPSFTARQLMAHTACIDNHYTELADGPVGGDLSVTGTYLLARHVLMRPPVPACVPGYLQFYSQPGYLLLGAFLEAATGQTVEQLIDKELSERFSLSSMQASILGGGNVLGLGIESNALDFATLVNGVFNGSIVSLRTSRSRLWQKVSAHSEFGLGWRLHDKRYAEARDDTASSSVRIWLDQRERSVIIIFAAQSKREPLDALLKRLQDLL